MNEMKSEHGRWSFVLSKMRVRIEVQICFHRLEIIPVLIASFVEGKQDRISWSKQFGNRMIRSISLFSTVSWHLIQFGEILGWFGNSSTISIAAIELSSLSREMLTKTQISRWCKHMAMREWSFALAPILYTLNIYISVPTRYIIICP